LWFAYLSLVSNLKFMQTNHKVERLQEEFFVNLKNGFEKHDEATILIS
jgi:hypothetical protein